MKVTDAQITFVLRQAEEGAGIEEIAETRVRYGYCRIHMLLRREGWSVNAKRVYRLYQELGLQLRNTETDQYRIYRPDPGSGSNVTFLSLSILDHVMPRISNPDFDSTVTRRADLVDVVFTRQIAVDGRILANGKKVAFVDV